MLSSRTREGIRTLGAHGRSRSRRRETPIVTATQTYVLRGTNATVADLLLLNRGSGASYERFSDLPQATAREGDTVQAIPGWKGTFRAAFLVNNSSKTRHGTPIEFVGG
jgi:hypothetical protein